MAQRDGSEPPPAEVTGRVATARPQALLDGIAAMCRTHDIPIDAAGAGHLGLEAGIGHIRFKALAGGVRVRIRATSGSNAFMLRESVLARVEEVDPALATHLTWSDTLPRNGLPPNFRIGRVRSVAAEGPLFWRLVLEAEDLAPFARDGLHLRLALPARDRAPVWPSVDPSGRTRWPDGADRLHLAVYTIRDIDPDGGTMVIDAFRHGRGATCGWLAAARPGDRLGLLGPGGGWLPEARHLTLAGDETALPAMARILASAPPDTVGTALIELDRAGDLPPVTAPRGVALRVVVRSRGESLEQELARTDLGPAEARYVWFAAEKRRAAAMRAELRDARGIARAESYVAGYWAEAS